LGRILSILLNAHCITTGTAAGGPNKKTGTGAGRPNVEKVVLITPVPRIAVHSLAGNQSPVTLLKLSPTSAPGPLFITQHPSVAYGIYAAYLLAHPITF